jgi:hypothetical protein
MKRKDDNDEIMVEPIMMIILYLKLPKRNLTLT